MKHLRVSRSLSLPLSLLFCGVTVLSAAAVRAAECPATSPDRTDERRALAKEWFARAEAAENAGNDVEAVKAYACSMKMVAHAFTAYNLGRVAERSGDLELALRSYKAYLTLKADAQDKDEVQAKITELEAKINQVKESIVGGEPATTEPGTGEEKPEVAVESPQEKVEKPLPIEPPPHVTQPVPEPRESSHIVEWVVGGAAVAVFAAAWIPNFMARSDMSKANSTNDPGSSQSHWDSAKTEAYTSYFLFGIAGAAAAVEAVLLIRLYSSSSGSDSSSDTSLGMGWTPGGLTLNARGRF
jgi:tetratricopeptide (TPR) repeat protein